MFRSPTLSFKAMVLGIGTGTTGNNFSLQSSSPNLKRGKETSGPRLASAIGSEPGRAQAQAPQRLALRSGGERRWGEPRDY